MSAAVAVLNPPEEETENVNTVEAEGPAKALEPETAIIFDWDDTLLCSTWLASQELRLDYPAEVPAEAREHLNLLEASVCSLLNTAIEHGPVCIITNAERGWVELSARKFLPKVLPLLSRVRVLSARSAFEARYPSPSDWKVQAFWHELTAKFEQLPPGYPKNAVSFGDSTHERHAIHQVTKSMSDAHTKSIKFVERPSAEQLKRQVDLVHSCFGDIISHKGDLDLMLTIHLFHDNDGEACDGYEHYDAYGN